MRNPCKECIYHISENNTCNSKKCATGDGRITFWDRLFCEPNTGENKKVRLIDAEDAVRLFEQSYPNDGQMSCHDAVAVIGTVPTIEPRKGKWIDEGVYADGHGAHAFRCSECGGHIIEYDADPFCRWCGADLRGEQK